MHLRHLARTTSRQHADAFIGTYRVYLHNSKLGFGPFVSFSVHGYRPSSRATSFTKVKVPCVVAYWHAPSSLLLWFSFLSLFLGLTIVADKCDGVVWYPLLIILSGLWAGLGDAACDRRPSNPTTQRVEKTQRKSTGT